MPPTQDPTRREMIWEAGGGFVGTVLTSLLAADGFFASPARAARTAAPASPLMPKSPHFPAKAKSCIFLFMYGGVSQVDTWDPKPELAKRNGEPLPNLDGDPLLKMRKPGTLLGSTRKFSRCGQSGIEVSDLFPHTAACVDDLAVIRSTYTDSFAHGSGLLQMNTGYLRQGFPSVGSWVTYGLGTWNQDLPAYVVLLDRRGPPIGGPPNWGCGFMPATYQGTQFRTVGDPVLFVEPPVGVTGAQQSQQLQLLRRLHELRGAATPENADLMARIASYELAFRMQTSVPEAVSLTKESQATRRLYGLDNPMTAEFGLKCLIARRLVERGVRFIQLYSGGADLENCWDAHTNVDKNHELHAMETDQPIAGLLTDLKARGLLDDTLVAWAGEFGRTSTSQNGKGRDHNPRGFSTWMAGGGVKGGQIIGATDDFGYAASEKKVHIHDLHATMLHLLGIDHTLLTYFYGGRNYRLTDVHGEVINDLIG